MENWTPQHIERYVHGKMSGAEELSFLADLERSPDLQKEVRKHRLALDAIDLLLKDQIADLYLQHHPQPSVLQRLLGYLRTSLQQIPRFFAPPVQKRAHSGTWALRMLALAAAGLLPVVFGLNWYTDRYCTDSAILTESYVVANAPSHLGDTENALSEGFEDYKFSRYSEAVSFFQKIPPSDSRYVEAQYYAGHSYYQLKNYESAEKAFDVVIQSDDVRFAESAEWNKVLSQLGNGASGNPAFKAALNKIADDNQHAFHAQAAALRKDLDGWLRKVFL